jgi:hypothetical protein
MNLNERINRFSMMIKKDYKDLKKEEYIENEEDYPLETYIAQQYVIPALEAMGLFTIGLFEGYSAQRASLPSSQNCEGAAPFFAILPLTYVNLMIGLGLGNHLHPGKVIGSGAAIIPAYFIGDSLGRGTSMLQDIITK